MAALRPWPSRASSSERLRPHREPSRLCSPTRSRSRSRMPHRPITRVPGLVRPRPPGRVALGRIPGGREARRPRAEPRCFPPRRPLPQRALEGDRADRGRRPGQQLTCGRSGAITKPPDRHRECRTCTPMPLYGNQALAVVALAAVLNSRCLAPGRAADHLDDEHDHESEQQEGDECGQESAVHVARRGRRARDTSARERRLLLLVGPLEHGGAASGPAPTSPAWSCAVRSRHQATCSRRRTSFRETRKAPALVAPTSGMSMSK